MKTKEALQIGVAIALTAGWSINTYNDQQRELSMQEQAILCKASVQEWHLQAVGRDMLLLENQNEFAEWVGMDLVNTGIAGFEIVEDGGEE